MAERQTQSTGAEDARRGLERGLEPSSFAEPRGAVPQRTEEGLHVCPDCGSELVHPVAWQAAGEARWRLSLRCPECGRIATGTYDQHSVDRLDEALERGTEELLDDLKALARANLEERIDRFAEALGSDHILPEDF